VYSQRLHLKHLHACNRRHDRTRSCWAYIPDHPHAVGYAERGEAAVRLVFVARKRPHALSRLPIPKPYVAAENMRCGDGQRVHRRDFETCASLSNSAL
jgi:hypothetical protein